MDRKLLGPMGCVLLLFPWLVIGLMCWAWGVF